MEWESVVRLMDFGGNTLSVLDYESNYIRVVYAFGLPRTVQIALMDAKENFVRVLDTLAAAKKL